MFAGIHNVVPALSKVVKIYVEKCNVVSTLPLINFKIGNVDSMLFNVVNSHVNIHVVVSTLI